MRTLAALTLVLLIAGCASLPKPSIEGALEQVRSACALLGEKDLDECAARLAEEAK